MPEYLMEALGLGLFMISACGFGLLLEHPASPIHQALPDATLRRVLMGLAMGTTAIVLIYSPWGMRSGAHINPAVTLTFFRLGRVPARDAIGYAASQFIGGTLGVALMSLLFGAALAHPAVRFVATVPGRWGTVPAFVAEVAISGILMFVVLAVSSHPRHASRTGLCAGALVATWIAIEAPISGMSMNPARSFASALTAGTWDSLWLYFVAPPLGMLAAAELFRYTVGRTRTSCAKLVHAENVRCIFCEAKERRAADVSREPTPVSAHSVGQR